MCEGEPSNDYENCYTHSSAQNALNDLRDSKWGDCVGSAYYSDRTLHCSKVFLFIFFTSFFYVLQVSQVL